MQSPERSSVVQLQLRIVGPVILAVCVLQLLHFAVIEPYYVPTGSMAPALLGRHRQAVCRRCGSECAIGCRGDGGCGHSKCWNCGQELASGNPVADGDRILVNKSSLWFGGPQRWEMVVFRLFGRDFIKRVIGLPGELIAIIAGDIYINQQLVRKSLAECKRTRVLIFDNQQQPAGTGWRQRWSVSGSGRVEIGKYIEIDSRASSGWNLVSYQHHDESQQKCRPINSELPYNGMEQQRGEPVHDFMVECDLEATGRTALVFGMNDGGDGVAVELSGGHMHVSKIAYPASSGSAWSVMPIRDSEEKLVPLKSRPLSLMKAGGKQRIELALVDRRFTFAVDGITAYTVDLPSAAARSAVSSPFWFAVMGGQVRLSNVRLYRDVHYTQAGQNAVHGKAVQLGVDQFFVLGDNTSNSEDSRYWPERGVVAADSMIGKPIAVYLPHWNRLR